MNESIYLIAVTLSEHASLKITSYRKKVFREFGYVSALALPPLIPLAWSQDRPNIETIPFVENPGIVIPAGQVVLEKNAFYLSLSPQNSHGYQIVSQWQGLFMDDGAGERFSEKASVNGDSGLFPVYPGIYICSHGDIGNKGKVELPVDSTIEKLEINDFRICCFMLEYNSAGIWWEDLFYAQLWSKRIT